MRPQDLIGMPPPVPDPGPPDPSVLRRQSRTERMQHIQELIDNFTFSLGSGLSASAEARGGARNKTYAGVGAALNAPAQLRAAQEAFALKKQQEAAAEQDRQAQLANTARQLAETERHNLVTEQPKPIEPSLFNTPGGTINESNIGAGFIPGTAPQAPKPADYTIGNQRFSGVTNQPIATGQETTSEGSYSPEKVIYQGKPTDVIRDMRKDSPTAGHVFIAQPNGPPKDVTGQTTPYTAPPSGIAIDNRLDKSYQYNDSALNKVGDPISQALTRFGNLTETVNQNTPQADALIAPELLTVMAGGQGSGLRMNEAEIARIVGGRSNVESLKAALNKWQIDPTKALTVTPAQRVQIRSLMEAVSGRLFRKQQIIDESRQALINADSVEAHRKIVADAKNKLNAVDQGQTPNGAEVRPGATIPDIIDGPNGAPMWNPKKYPNGHP